MLSTAPRPVVNWSSISRSRSSNRSSSCKICLQMGTLKELRDLVNVGSDRFASRIINGVLRSSGRQGGRWDDSILRRAKMVFFVIRIENNKEPLIAE